MVSRGVEGCRVGRVGMGCRGVELVSRFGVEGSRPGLSGAHASPARRTARSAPRRARGRRRSPERLHVRLRATRESSVQSGASHLGVAVAVGGEGGLAVDARVIFAILAHLHSVVRHPLVEVRSTLRLQAGHLHDCAGVDGGLFSFVHFIATRSHADSPASQLTSSPSLSLSWPRPISSRPELSQTALISGPQAHTGS